LIEIPEKSIITNVNITKSAIKSHKFLIFGPATLPCPIPAGAFLRSR
jgi:hypothetical protein